MKNFKMVKWNSTVNAIVLLIFGLLLLIYPEESLNIGGYLIASILMLMGLGNIIKIIQKKGIETNGDIFSIVFGIAAITISISIFVNPTWIIKIINVFVGILLIISSIMNFMDLLKYKKNKTKSWWTYLVFVILIFIIGIVIILDPLFLARIIVRLEGATLIINTIITFFLTRKVNKYLMLELEKKNNEIQVL